MAWHPCAEERHSSSSSSRLQWQAARQLTGAAPLLGGQGGHAETFCRERTGGGEENLIDLAGPPAKLLLTPGQGVSRASAPSRLPCLSSTAGGGMPMQPAADVTGGWAASSVRRAPQGHKQPFSHRLSRGAQHALGLSIRSCPAAE